MLGCAGVSIKLPAADAFFIGASSQTGARKSPRGTTLIFPNEASDSGKLRLVFTCLAVSDVLSGT